VATAALATAALALVGCSSATDTQTPTSAAAVASSSAPAVQGPGVSASDSAAARPESPQRVDVQAFAEVVGQPGVTVLDVRTPEEFAAGHLEGAVNINLESPEFGTQVAELDPAGTYAVYCRSGNRSAVAVGIMAEQGITGTYDLDGGIVDWEAAGLPVVT
jgi:rhodanese-related sulfurtransferase